MNSKKIVIGEPLRGRLYQAGNLAGDVTLRKSSLPWPLTSLFGAEADPTVLPPVVSTSLMKGIATYESPFGRHKRWNEPIFVTVKAVRNKFGSWDLTARTGLFGKAPAGRYLSDDAMLQKLLGLELEDARQKGFREYHAQLIAEHGESSPPGHILRVLFNQAVLMRTERLAAEAAKEKPQSEPSIKPAVCKPGISA